MSEQFLKHNICLTSIRYNTSEQLKYHLEHIIGMQQPTGTSQKKKFLYSRCAKGNKLSHTEENNIIAQRNKTMVFCYQNCSDLLCEKKCFNNGEKFSKTFAKSLRSLEQFIQTVKGQNNFWEQNAFLTCSWRFLLSDKLEHI